MQVMPAQPQCILDDPWTSSDPESYMRQLCAPGYYGQQLHIQLLAVPAILHGPVCNLVNSGKVP